MSLPSRVSDARSVYVRPLSMPRRSFIIYVKDIPARMGWWWRRCVSVSLPRLYSSIPSSGLSSQWVSFEAMTVDMMPFERLCMA